MADDETELADRLDRFWDTVTLGRSNPPIGLDATLAAAIHRFNALPDDPLPPPVRRRLVAGPVPQPAPSRLATGLVNALPRLHAPSRRVVPFAATAALIALLLSSGLLAYRLAAPSPTGQGSHPSQLFVTGDFTDDAAAQRLLPLDPETLDDLPNRDFIDLGSSEAFAIALSGDGSTLAVIEWADEDDTANPSTTIVVRDGRTGAERTRFQPPSMVWSPTLSHDGTRLVARAWDGDHWYVFDTADGRLVATVLVGSPSDTWVAPSARYMYQLVPVPGSAVPGQLWTARLLAYDLNTGQESGRLDLPAVLVGARPAEVSLQESPGDEELINLAPGGALSPDGKQLVIVHADADAMTIVDTERFVVERTVAVAHATTWRDRLTALLPFAPRDAAAKGSYLGIQRRAVFAPDGRHLYVYGAEILPDAEGKPTARGLGLWLVDVERAEVIAEALPDVQLIDVVPAPDGQSVYVLGPPEPRVPYDVDPGLLLLRRLDPTTLETLAEREVHGWTEVLVRDGSPDGL